MTVFGFKVRVGSIAAAVGLIWTTASGAQDGFRLQDNQIIVDRGEHWEAWTKPEHAIDVDLAADLVRPRLIQRQTNAIADMADFTILIGDAKARDKLGKDVNRAGGVMPLNIRSQSASVAGVPIVHQKDKSKDGIKAGDPIEWFYFYGGIREAPRNTDAAWNVLDGDPESYWEPTTQVEESAWRELSEADRGPKIFFAPGDDGEEIVVDSLTWAAASSRQRRVEFHSHSLDEWYIDIELGRVVPVRKIVLKFVDPDVGEPFRQFRILGTASHFRDAALGLIARTNTPNTEQRDVTFEFDGSGSVGTAVDGLTATPLEPDAKQAYRQLHRIRIAVTDSRFDRFRKLDTEAEYLALPLADRGSIEYHIVNAVGTETRVTREIYEQVSEDRRGRLVYYQRERPRLADVEVWTQGDNVSLGVIDGGGSVELTGTFGGDPGFDGLYESNYLQLVWSPDARFADRGIMTLDLGARFWLDFFRMVGFFSGTDELATWISDGSRDSNGNLRFTEIDRDPSGQGRSNLEIAIDPVPVRYVRTQIFSDAPGRAGGYNTGDRVREMQSFGQGFPSEVTLTSPMIEVPGSLFLGTIRWEADIPDSAQVNVEIRTRTGDRLVEVTEYFGSGGEPKTETEYNKLPASFKGPSVTRRVPGGGWSSWSQSYLLPGQRVTSPSPRRFLQFQVRMLSSTPDLAAAMRSLQVEMLPPAALASLAEVWPSEVELGVRQDFELFVRPTFVEQDPGNQPSSRFDELLVDAAPIEDVEVVEVALGDEAAFEAGAAQVFTELATRTDPETGAPTTWFAGPDDTRYQALVDAATGDSLKIIEGRVAGGALQEGDASQFLLRLPTKVASLSEDVEPRVYNRRIVDVDDEVPVDDDGRLLNELTYLALPIELQGRILYFEITGTSADGEPLQQELDEFDFRALPDSLQGEIRYFRKLVGTGGEFAFGRDGAPLTQTAYGRLPRAERGSIQASGQLVRIGFRAKVLLNGSTLDVAIRDSEGDAVWQLVDAGDATSIHPGGDLSIAVPFNRKVLRLVGVDPPAFSPNGDGINDEAEIRFSVANVNVSRQIEVRIYDLSGRLMWREERMSFGDQTFRWPGTDNDGNHVPPGLYLCRVDVDVDSQGASKQSDHRIIAVAY